MTRGGQSLPLGECYKILQILVIYVSVTIGHQRGRIIIAQAQPSGAYTITPIASSQHGNVSHREQNLLC